MTTIKFFAIGAWTEGMMHFSKLKPFIVTYESATIQADVYLLPIGFPVLHNDKQYKIEGQLFELTYDAALMALIDTLHGVHPHDPVKGLFFRERVVVQKSSGDQEMAQVYFINPKKLNSKCKKIENGNWAQLSQEQQPLPLQLSERQRHYVMKLGAVKGRDIVPINDLTLYRELMKLELIVDKGRRLALSSLGKEVYNHLLG